MNNLTQPKRIGMVCRGEDDDILVLKRLIECVEGRAEVILDELNETKGDLAEAISRLCEE